MILCGMRSIWRALRVVSESHCDWLPDLPGGPTLTARSQQRLVLMSGGAVAAGRMVVDIPDLKLGVV